MDRSQRRILRLRNHVLRHKHNNFIKDIDKAHSLALKEELSNKNVKDLEEIAKGKGLEGYSKLKKDELIQELVGD